MATLTNILYLEPNRCFLYGESIPGGTSQIDFPLDAAQDAEVISREKLTTLIQAFLQTNSIPAGNMTLIISPQLTFEKDLIDIPFDQQEIESQKFFDTVPFENVAPLRATVNQKKMIIATNKDFIETVRSAFTTQGFMVPAAVPASVLQRIVPELQTTLDLKLMYTKVDMVKQYNFLTIQELPKIPETFTGKPRNKGRMLLLAGVFAVLLLVLGYMIITNVLHIFPS